MGRFLPVCFFPKPTISREAAFGEIQNAAERQELGGKRTLVKMTAKGHFMAYSVEKVDLLEDRIIFF
jgi:hypothetical protein